MRSLRNILDEGNPNKMPSGAQLARLGSAVALVPRRIRAAVVANTLALPDNAKAEAILNGFVVAGGTTGPVTPVLGAAPATTEVGISLTGDIVFQATDAVTEAEVVYLAQEGDVVEEMLVVAADSASLASGRKAIRLLEAESLEGTTVGALAVEARGAAPGAGEASQDLDGAVVSFNAGDAVTRARVKYIALPGAGTKAAIGTNLDSADRLF